MATPADIQALLDGPALAPPDGQTSQFTNPPGSIQTGLYWAAGVTLAFPVMAVCIRIYTVWFINRNFAWENYTLLGATAGFITIMGITIAGISNGLGIHQWDIQVKQLTPILINLRLVSIVYCPTITLIKISILLQYLRIFAPFRKANLVYIGSWTLIWGSVLAFTIFTFIAIFICTPIEKFWSPLMTGGHCINDGNINISSGVITSASDIMILILPQQTIWKLQMSQKRRLSISAMFLTGGIACVASVVRLYYCVKLKQTTDTTYILSILGAWTEAEVAGGIICCCLPVFPRFFQTIGPKLMDFSKLGLARTSIGNLVTKSSMKHSTTLSHPKDTWKDLYSSQNRPSQPYKHLDGQELQAIARQKIIRNTGESNEELSANPETSIHVKHEIEIVSMPAEDGSFDLEKQQRAIPSHTGW